MRAEVSADDVSLTCAPPEPYVGYLGHALLGGFNGADSRLYPGETAGLVLRVRNYGARTSATHVELSTADPLVVVTHGSADYGALPTGGIADNPDDPMLIEVSPETPEGRLIEFTVEVAHDGGTTVSHFTQCIGRRHFLVWDPTPDASGGDDIYLALRGLHYSGRYAAVLTADGIADCQTLWVSLGIRPYNHVVMAGCEEAQLITSFLAAGGGVYLEGGDVWHADPGAGGHDFRPVFEITSLSDGGGDLYQIVGDAGTFAEGILMSYQGENNSIDRIGPAHSSFRLWRNNAPTYGCAVAGDAGSGRTVGASIEFAGMRDAQHPNTKAEMAFRVMCFLIPPDPQSVRPDNDPAVSAPLLELAPNPWARGTVLRCRSALGELAGLELYDAGGRRLQTLHAGPLVPGTQTLRLSTAGLAPGCYFVAPPNLGVRRAVKLIVMR